MTAIEHAATRVNGRRYRDEWLPNFYPSREIAPNRWLRISRSGSTLILSADDDGQIGEFSMTEELYQRMQKSGHIVTKDNAHMVLQNLETWQKLTHSGPQLHIVTVTKRCNLACKYCHMNPVPVSALASTADLSPETAVQVARFIMATPNEDLAIEFQGGEPFLNMKAVRSLVEEVNRIEKETGRKRASFSLVSNMLAAKDADIQYCADNDIGISYTINGPSDVHDSYRITAAGKGTFAAVMERVLEIRGKHPELISSTPLCVLDEHSIGNIEQIIDFFYDNDFSGMALIPLKPLGFARKNFSSLDAARYIDGYLKGLDLILAKNRGSGKPFGERMAHVALAKIFANSDVGFVDWRNPCGDVVGAVVYDYDGEILPADEARSMRDVFSLGNVHSDTYQDVIAKPSSFRTTSASIRDRHGPCRECTYNPYCGVMPVIEFAKSGTIEVLPYESDDCLFTRRFLDWLFAALMNDPLPLMRMIPTFDNVAFSILDR